MKIRTRLSVSFSLIASAIFIAFAFTVYLFSANYRQHDFQERLKERVVITEKIFLEKESFSQVELAKINNEFLHTLPQETEEVLLLQPDNVPTFKHNYPQEVRSKLIAQNDYDFYDSDLQGTSRIFQVGGKDYLIIVTAIDEVGLQNLSFLKNVILLLVIIGIPLIFVGSFMITKRALLPISKKIDKANTISISNMHQRLNVYNPNDELGKMAIAFNKLLDRLEASFEAQKSFIRNASHEIRNPLTTIIGEAEVAISKSRTQEEYVDSLQVILVEAETLNSTVNNLLNLSKVSANEENIQFEPIQFDSFLFDIKETFNFLIPENQVTLNLSSETKSELYTISGNKNLLVSAIVNLFDNACKFSSNRLVVVSLTADHSQLTLSIKDQGIGIIPQDIEMIMTPFYRGNNAIKIKGSGIGLSLSSKIIDLHRGKLEIQSQIDVGTEVHVKLPVQLS